MNERIKQLAEQATVFVADYDGQRWQIDPEKFAELIVAECVSVCESEGYRLSMDTTTQYHRNLAKQCHKICAMLEQHFGVEE